MIISALLVIFIFVPNTIFAQNIDMLFADAEESFLNGNYREAIMIYDEILKNDHSNS